MLFATKVSIFNSEDFINLNKNEIEMSSSFLTEHLIFNLINFYKKITKNDIILLEVN